MDTTKTFGAKLERARELEAQARQLRQEDHAERIAAYADVLESVFPKVKFMTSEDKLRAYMDRRRIYADALVAAFPEIVDLRSEADVRMFINHLKDEHAPAADGDRDFLVVPHIVPITGAGHGVVSSAV